MHNIYRQIKHHEKNLTKLELEVAEYFLNKNRPLSLRALSTKIHLSPATISRFVRKIDFESYEEFIKIYSKMLEINEDANYGIYERHLEIVKKNHELIEKFANNNLLNKMINHRVLIVAFEDTAFACMDFVNRLKRIGIDARIATTKQSMMLEANFLAIDDVIIIVSISGYNKMIDQFIKQQNKHVNYIFAVSTVETTMIHQCSEFIVLYLDSNSIISFDYSYSLPLIIYFDYLFIKLQTLIKVETRAQKNKVTNQIISEGNEKI